MLSQTKSKERGFITIMTGHYSFIDCFHLVASIRKHHDETIVILTQGVSKPLRYLFNVWKNVEFFELQPIKDKVLSSRLAKVNLFNLTPFKKTIYIDSDCCLLTGVKELFQQLRTDELLLVPDVRPRICNDKGHVRTDSFDLTVLQSLGFRITHKTAQFNSGLLCFTKCDDNKTLFDKWKEQLKIVLRHQDILHKRDQLALASAIEITKPRIKVLPTSYNFQSMWESYYPNKVNARILHCTYPYRPQSAKNVTRSIYTRVVTEILSKTLPNQLDNPWKAGRP